MPQFLAWVAGRTERIRLGTMVTVLPWPDPVRANLVSPGLVLPETAEGLGAHSIWHDQKNVMNESQVEYVVRNTPLRKRSTPEDIAASVVFLASDQSRQLTGQHLVVSGGFAMR